MIHDLAAWVAALSLIAALVSMVLPRKAETSKRLSIPLLILFIVSLLVFFFTE